MTQVHSLQWWEVCHIPQITILGQEPWLTSPQPHRIHEEMLWWPGLSKGKLVGHPEGQSHQNSPMFAFEFECCAHMYICIYIYIHLYTRHIYIYATPLKSLPFLWASSVQTAERFLRWNTNSVNTIVFVRIIRFILFTLLVLKRSTLFRKGSQYWGFSCLIELFLLKWNYSFLKVSVIWFHCPFVQVVILPASCRFDTQRALSHFPFRVADWPLTYVPWWGKTALPFQVCICSCTLVFLSWRSGVYKLAPEPLAGVMASSFDWDEWDADAFDLDAAASHGLHLGDPEPARDSFQGPQNDEPNPFDDVAPSEKSWYWKCLACDSAVSAWDGEMWRCSRCNSKDFYQTDRPAKRFTSDGTWMFMPHGHGQDSKPRRRRRKKHPHPDDTGSEWIDERGEEESKTTDPCVDPEPLHPGSQRDNPHEDQPHRRLPEPRALRNDQVRLGGGSGTQTSTDGQLLKALQRLVTSKKQDDDWASASGPQKGVRWRGGAPPQPPIWRYDKDDLRAYSKYVKKIDIWKLQVAPFMSRKEMALALYNSLQGEAEQELEYTPIEEFYVDDGVEKIVAALKGPMEQKAVYQKRKFLNEFENIRRYAGETMRSYVNRFRRTQRCLKSVGVDVSLTYDQESMGSRLLDRSGLSQEGQRLILVGTQQKLDFELVVESMMLQYPEFRGAPPVISRDGSAVSKGSGKGSGRTMSSSTTASSSSSMASSRSSSSTGKGSFGKGSFVRKQVHVTEIDQGDQQEDEEFLDPIEEGDEQNDVSDQNQQDDDGQTYDEDADQQEDLDLGELAQVLTLTAKKLSNVTLGRKFTGRPKPKPKQKSKLTPEDKPNTHCSACGGLGHWKDDPECPKNGGSGGPAAPRSSGDKKNAYGKPAHRVGIIHHEHGSLEINTPTSETTYANMFTSFMTIHQPFSVHDVNIATSESLIGYVILDTGCQRTCCGARWLQGHSKLLRRFGLHPKVIQHYDEFKFGKGDVSYAHDKAYFPSAINGCGLILAASVLEEDIPFLISNSLLTYLGGIFNLVTDEIYFQKLGIGTKIHRKCGHLVMNIAEFCAENPSDWQVWQQLSHPDLWKDPPPECLVPQDRIVTLSPTDQFANASAAAMLVAEAEEVGLQGKESHEDGVGQLDDRHQNENPSSKRASSLSSGGRRSPTKPSFMYPSSHEATRECPRSVRNMHRLQDVMEVDRKSENVGTSWTARTLFGIASLAVAIFGNGDQSSGIRQASSSGEIPSKVPPYTSHYIPDETFGINEAETIFNHEEIKMDHLNDKDQLEVFHLVEMESPLEVPARTWEEHAWLNEECHRESREEMERQADQRRWDRLRELGALPAVDDEIYDWETVVEDQSWRVDQWSSCEGNGRNQLSFSPRNTRSTWLQSLPLFGPLRMQISGNYLLDELYAQNLHQSMVLMHFNLGISFMDKTSWNVINDRKPWTPWGGWNLTSRCWASIADTILCSTRTWTTRIDHRNGCSSNVKINLCWTSQFVLPKNSYNQDDTFWLKTPFVLSFGNRQPSRSCRDTRMSGWLRVIQVHLEQRSTANQSPNPSGSWAICLDLMKLWIKDWTLTRGSNVNPLKDPSPEHPRSILKSFADAYFLNYKSWWDG